MALPLLLLVLLHPLLARAQLRLESWPGVSFSPPSSATLTLVPSANLSAAGGFAPADYTSHRLTGTLTSPVDDLLVLSVETDSGVRVWLNDWLSVDGGVNQATASAAVWAPSEGVYRGDGSLGRRHFSSPTPPSTPFSPSSSSSGCGRTVTAFLGIPVQAGVPLPLRVEYTRMSSQESGGCPPSLLLLWKGNGTSTPSPVPAAAVSPAVSDGFLQRMALRARLEAPSVAAAPLASPRTPWQTYDIRNMLAHARMPDGVAVSATLADLTTGEVLGDVHVFPRFAPATVRPGLKSINGSDYSRVDVSAWGGRNCTVRVESATTSSSSSSSSEGDQLLLLATPDGAPGCASLALFVVVVPMAERAAQSAPALGGAAIQVDVPGFSSFTVTPSTESPPLVPYPVPTPNNVTAFLALPLGNGPVAVSAGAAASAPSLPAVQAAVAAGEQACDGEAAAWVAAGGGGADLVDVTHSVFNVMAWNSIFTPFEGVTTPVTRAWNGGSGYTLFDWDTLLGAVVMAARGRANSVWADVAVSNLLQILLARTVEGAVPNYASGPHISFDRTEPQVGSVVLQRIYAQLGSAGWVVDVALGPLLSWSDWFWARRRGEGVFAGSDGHADLISLGSDPNVPCDACIGNNTFAGARYESGLDNSAQYEWAENGTGVGFDPVTSHHMFLYDVGFTALYVADLTALIALCEIAGRFDEVPVLQDRLARVTAAMQAHLWNADDGMFTNVLYDGTPHGRYAPTAFFPLLAPGVATDAQADAMMATMNAPSGFCLNASFTPDPSAAVLVDLWDGVHDNAAGTTDDFVGAVVGAKYSFVRAEAAVLNATAPLADGVVLPLNLFYSALYNDYALTTNGTGSGDGGGLGPSYSFVRREGACFATGSTPTGTWGTTPLTLWFNAARQDYQVCGSPKCLSDVSVLKYTFVTTLCTAWNATGFENLPCTGGPVALPSIQRSDESFYDNTYWRGRAWGPHYYLTYLGLAAFDHVPSVREARRALVAAGRVVSLRNWEVFGHVAENGNGVLLGVPEDVPNADPFYTWGALFGFITLVEEGLA
jgi:hypothetical protein